MSIHIHVVNEPIVQLWTILDFSSNPKTGMVETTDVTFTLHRESGAVMVAATEDVVMTEIGVTGHYSIVFTPTNTGLYVLQLKEINATSLQRTFKFPDADVVAAGSVFLPSFANAYCGQSDVERWTQLVFTATSKPTLTAVTAFAEARASELSALLAVSGAAITPDTVVADSIEEDLLREANAVGAALDAHVVKFLQETPNQTGKAALLIEEWKRRIEEIEVYWRGVVSEGGLRTHISTGEVTLKDEGTTTDTGLNTGIRMDDEF